MPNSTLSASLSTAGRAPLIDVGWLIIASFNSPYRILAAYLASDPAKERGVSATYLLTGYLKQDSAANGNSNGNGTDAMDIDGLDATQSSQNGAGGEEEALAEIVKTKTMMVVQQDELEGKSGGFLSRPHFAS